MINLFKSIFFGLLLVFGSSLIAQEKLPSTNENRTTDTPRVQKVSQNSPDTTRRNINPPPSWLEEEHASAESKEANQFVSEFMHLVLTLFFVLAVILIIAWVLKKILASRVTQLNTSSSIKILERRTLSPKATIFLIEVAGQRLIVAESASGVQRLGAVHSDAGWETAPQEETKQNL